MAQRQSAASPAINFLGAIPGILLEKAKVEDLRLVHIPGAGNTVADFLSRPLENGRAAPNRRKWGTSRSPRWGFEAKAFISWHHQVVNQTCGKPLKVRKDSDLGTPCSNEEKGASSDGRDAHLPPYFCFRVEKFEFGRLAQLWLALGHLWERATYGSQEWGCFFIWLLAWALWPFHAIDKGRSAWQQMNPQADSAPSSEGSR